METSKLKKFAQFARRQLMEQVEGKLGVVLAEGSAARRERAEAVQKLEEQIAQKNKAQVIEQVAYTWFNRICALRYMDVKRYTRIGVVSPAEGQFQPEILAEAKMGHVDEDIVPKKIREQVFALLQGAVPSPDAQAEAYRLLIVAVCNDYHRVMPFLFERIDDYTELLMPDDLLSGNSIAAYTREAMTPKACQDVEIIGWLYQFYISEKKDEVFAGLKKNKKITPENIPAATQLFTPHWIVRYLVENSLGRLWLLNRPESGLKAQMDYYIEPEQAETNFLQVGSPEELKICDPACGSGHMLVYAFDLLYAIYEEEGYAPEEIPGKVLTCNLYGIEIDERAGALAAFALTMKARERQRRFFRKGVEPNICVLENVRFEEGELDEYMDFVGKDLFTASLLETLRKFEEADNFGSLIRPYVNNIKKITELLEKKNFEEQLMLYPVHQKVLKAIEQTGYLSTQYHIIVTNPPYMGSKGMNGRLGAWTKKNYSESKSDLFAMFIERGIELVIKMGYCSMITMQNWMFITSFENLRENLLKEKNILTLIQIGYNSFPDLNSKVAQACAFVIHKCTDETSGIYLNLNDAPQSADKEAVFLRKRDTSDFFISSKTNFNKVPGRPISYWVPHELSEIFSNKLSFNDVLEPREGLTTGNNEKHVRYSFEVSFQNICRSAENRKDAKKSGRKWFPYNKGGDLRKWSGNDLFLVNWEKDGAELQNVLHPSGKRIWAHNFNLDFIFRPFITWSDITTKGLAVRSFSAGYLFDATGLSAFERNDESYRYYAMGLCNSSVGFYLSKILNPTMHFKSGDFGRIPLVEEQKTSIENSVQQLVKIFAEDWRSIETSWDFSASPLLEHEYRQLPLQNNWRKLFQCYQQIVLNVQQMEEENNRIFIRAYKLQEEIAPEVPLNEITLTCNPHYRYNSPKPEAELEALLLADTMREFISYSVGCMFGRYSLDAPGLILANQGETLTDYLTRIPNPTFTPDEDNVIPILDSEWFTDDITGRFYDFLRTTFGTEHYTENLKFIEDAIGKDIRKFFLKDFYKDHIKRYKKRPIYWLFSSPKGTFNALIYMHRYRPDTVSVILNDYLRQFQTKLQARKSQREQISISAAASNADKTRALKDIDKLNKQILELETYERDILYPLATKQIEIDLDDGVKVNYPKFGKALKKVPGLS